MRDTNDPQHDELDLACQSNSHQLWVDRYYYLGKASFVIRVIEYLQNLQNCQSTSVKFLTVLNYQYGWIIRIKSKESWPLESVLNFQAFMNEFGLFYYPDESKKLIFLALETGSSLIEVMNQYGVSVIDHGEPKIDEIEIFRKNVVEGLGYCPETLA